MPSPLVADPATGQPVMCLAHDPEFRTVAGTFNAQMMHEKWVMPRD